MFERYEQVTLLSVVVSATLRPTCFKRKTSAREKVFFLLTG